MMLPMPACCCSEMLRSCCWPKVNSCVWWTGAFVIAGGAVGSGSCPNGPPAWPGKMTRSMPGMLTGRLMLTKSPMPTWGGVGQTSAMWSAVAYLFRLLFRGDALRALAATLLTRLTLASSPE